MQLHPRVTCLSILRMALFLMASPVIATSAQAQVAKPIATSGVRLPAPTRVVASQESDGRIRVVWSGVPGATSYAVVRSVPPGGAQPMVPNPTDTVFFDTDVMAGSTYYYVVAAINEAGTAGLKVGSIPVKATRNATNTGVNSTEPSALSAPTNVHASLGLTGRGTTDLGWQFGNRYGLYFLMERMVSSDPKAGWQRVSQTQSPTSPMHAVGTFRSNLDGMLAEGTRVVWRVTAIDSATGAHSAPTESNELIVGRQTVIGGTSAHSAPVTAGGTIAVSMGASVSVRIGGTASLVSALGGSSASRWVSLDEGTATVDASGIATGRAAGRAHILALGRGSDGSVRVTLVVVTVTP